MIKKRFLLLLIWTLGLQAQNPVIWKTDFQKNTESEFILEFTASIEPKWHLYSQNLPKEGPLPTEFEFERVGIDFELMGKTEEGNTITAFDPIFEMDLSWFDGKATFRQKIRLLKPELVSITGQIQFQACDDKLCIFRNEPFRFLLDPSQSGSEEQKTIDSKS